MKIKMVFVSVVFIIGFGLGIGYSQFSKKAKLDKYYFERFKMIKDGMIWGSAADTMKELEDYQNQTELCMHLDGYSGIEVMDVRCRAFKAALEKKG